MWRAFLGNVDHPKAEARMRKETHEAKVLERMKKIYRRSRR